MIGMNLVFSGSSYPFGALADRVRPTTLLAVGLVLLALSDVVFALRADVWGIGLGVVLWGLHLGATQGVLSMLVAKTTEADWRATGFGLFNLASGASLLVAGAAAGCLWDAAGPAASFGFGAVFAVVALVWLLTGVRAVRASGRVNLSHRLGGSHDFLKSCRMLFEWSLPYAGSTVVFAQDDFEGCSGCLPTLSHREGGASTYT